MQKIEADAIVPHQRLFEEKNPDFEQSLLYLVPYYADMKQC